MNNSRDCSILDFPDEILLKIILHFDARERLALGNSCQRFYNLVFGDTELLRNLDFTREWQLMKESDIQQYFNDENTYKRILRLNTAHVRAVSSLSSSIGKAINLVELNILSGLQFESVEEFARFLQPLVQLKRLSVNWPESDLDTNYDNPDWNKVLEEPFGRLTYLSLKISWYTTHFLVILQLCQQLEELRMSILREAFSEGHLLRREPIKLSNLKFVRLIAIGNSRLLRHDFMSFVPDPAEWTDFYLVDLDSEVYLERNVEVCAELEKVKKMPLPQSIADDRVTDEGWPLVPEHLLSEAIRVNHEDVPEKFCCFSWPEYPAGQPCRFEIDEAKKLLKDPGYRVTYLHFSHIIEKNCDVHLFASAFPNLTTLVLSRISNRHSPGKTKPLRRRLRKKGSLESEKHSDAKYTDSSFKMLIENTPRLEVLVISPGNCRYNENEAEYWDFDALDLISRWKNLTVIRLADIPITDGKFLIDIGKECKKLEHVTLYRLSPNESCSWESELLQMLQHCKNLKKLAIWGMSLEHLSEMFNILSNCSRLKDLDIETTIDECPYLDLVSSVEKMLRQCQELNKFSVKSSMCGAFYKFNPAVERIISELNRPNFQFTTSGPKFDDENSSDSFFSNPLVFFPRF